MSLEQLYVIAGNNFDDVILRVPSEELLFKLLKMFLDDKSKSDLDKAVKENNSSDAFRAVHTLKGVTLSLGLSNLSEPCKALTEDLRAGSFGKGWEENYKNVCTEYAKIIDAIREL